MATKDHLSGLEEELSALLEVERFEPPAEFREQALWSDPRSTRRPRPTPRPGGCARRPSCSTGSRSRAEALDDSNPPFYKWFADGRLNASANCLDRHVEAGRGDRVAYHWRGEEGEERDVTYAELLRDVAALRQRAAATAASARATWSGSTCR